MNKRFKPELPPQLTLHNQLLNYTNELSDLIIPQLQAAGASDYTIHLFQEHPAIIFNSAYFGGCEGDDRPAPYPDVYRTNGSILGSDQVAVSYLAPFDDESGSGHVVAIQLFNDGSPYVPDQELEYGVNRFLVFAGHDIPPTAVNEGLLTRLGISPGYGSTKEITAVLRDLSEEALHQLDNNECSELVSILNQAKVDISIAEMAREF